VLFVLRRIGIRPETILAANPTVAATNREIRLELASDRRSLLDGRGLLLVGRGRVATDVDFPTPGASWTNRDILPWHGVYPFVQSGSVAFTTPWIWNSVVK